MSATVEILAIGNELLRGEIQDTNTTWICRLINSRGGQVRRVTMLPDSGEEIAAAVRSAIDRKTALLFTSGGLGPTDDDLTLAAVAAGAGVQVALNPVARQMVKEYYDAFHARGILAEGGLNPFREKMAWLPTGASPIHNPVGTAPGVLLRTEKTAIISLPGVPQELEGIITHSLAGLLGKTFGNGASFTRTMTVRCNDESIIAPALSKVISRYPRVYIKSLARVLGEIPELDILFTIAGSHAAEDQHLVDNAFSEFQQHLTAGGFIHREKEGTHT